MKKYSDMTHAELVERLQNVESGQSAFERDTLIHNLEVHQVELESQNQQLRETQALLEESRVRYADLYDFAPVSYCTFDSNGCIIEINLTGAALLGIDRSSLLGKPFILFVSPPDRPAFLKHLKGCIDQECDAVTDLTLMLKSRSPIVVQMVSTQSGGKYQPGTGCRAALTDISERKQSEQALHLAVRMREDFLAVVSHDLKNPLSSILLGLQGVLRTLSGEDKGHNNNPQLLLLMQRAAMRMNRLIEDLLDLSSMDAGHLSMRRDVYEVAEIVAAVYEALGPLAAKKSIRLEAKIEDGLLGYCDHDRIIQVLLNLVGNAIKFTLPDGLIRIAAERRVGGVILSVSDTGFGIAGPQLARIFDPYWQGQKRPGQGTGLGLSIAKGIVEFHGGKLWVESQLDHGSTFYFTLPPMASSISKKGPVSGPVLSPAAVSSQERRRAAAGQLILIVDNDEDTRDSLAQVLADEGYEIAICGNGAEALKYLWQAKQKPSVILLDLHMPVMDGWEFLAHRSHDKLLAGVPVIIVSAQTAGLGTSGLGYEGCVQKPVEIGTLLQKIEQASHREKGSAFGPLPH